MSPGEALSKKVSGGKVWPRTSQASASSWHRVGLSRWSEEGLLTGRVTRKRKAWGGGDESPGAEQNHCSIPAATFQGGAEVSGPETIVGTQSSQEQGILQLFRGGDGKIFNN